MKLFPSDIKHTKTIHTLLSPMLAWTMIQTMIRKRPLNCKFYAIPPAAPIGMLHFNRHIRSSSSI